MNVSVQQNDWEACNDFDTSQSKKTAHRVALHGLNPVMAAPWRGDFTPPLLGNNQPSLWSGGTNFNGWAVLPGEIPGVIYLIGLSDMNHPTVHHMP